MAQFTEQQRMELIDVVEVLNDTVGTTNEEFGVTFERISGFSSDGVRYVDTQSGEELRTMSASAYAAEFYKVCGNSLDDANFDEVLTELVYVGNLLGGLVITSVGVEGLRALATDEAQEFGRKYPIGDGDYC